MHMSQVSISNEHTDSFGRSTGVRVQINTRQVPLGKTGVWLSSLLIVPVAPLVGGLIGLIAARRIADDASLLGRGKAKYAMRMGVAGTALQLLAFMAFYYMAMLSIQDASSIIQARATGELGMQGASSVEVYPGFGIVEFFPGTSRTYAVESQGIERTATVRFDSVPTWTSAGPMFGATVVDMPSEFASNNQ
ncbi:MAG: hypothetical protein Phyf2KO_10560 [Phycisphaerales bacterium]